MLLECFHPIASEVRKVDFALTLLPSSRLLSCSRSFPRRQLGTRQIQNPECLGFSKSNDKFKLEINITCDDIVKHGWISREERSFTL